MIFQKADSGQIMPFWNVAQSNLSTALSKDVSALTEYQRLMDSGYTKQNAFAEAMLGASKTAQVYSDKTQINSETIKAFQINQEAANKSVGGFSAVGKSMVGVLKNIGASLLNMAIVTAAFWAVSQIVTAISNQINATKILKDRIDELGTAYEEAKSQVADANSNLEETKSKIDELKSKGPLTLIEQEQLDLLRAANKELSITLNTTKNAAKAAAIELANAQEQLFNRVYADDNFSESDLAKRIAKENNLKDYGVFNYSTNRLLTDDIAAQLSAYKEAQAELLKSSTSEDIDYWKTEMNDISSILNSHLQDLQNIKTDISAVDEADRTSSQKAILDTIDSGITLLFKTINPSEWLTQSFDEVFSSDKFKSAKDSLISLAEQGNLTADALSGKEYAKLVSALEEVGISADQTVEHLSAIYPAVIGSSPGVDSYGSLAAEYTKIKETQEKAREILSSDSPVTTEQYDELIAANAEYANAFEVGAYGISLNAEAVKKLQIAEQKELATKIALAKAQKIQDYKDAAKEIALNEKAVSLLSETTDDYLATSILVGLNLEDEAKKLEDSTKARDDGIDSIEDETSALKDKQAALLDEIKGYDRLATELTYATSAYKAWLDAQDEPESGDMYRGMLGALEALQEGLKTGATYTKKYQAALAMLVPDDQHGNVAAYIKSLEGYLEEGTDGLESFYDKLIKEGFLKKLKDGSAEWTDQFSLADIAEKMGFTEDFVQASLLGLQEHGLNVDFLSPYLEVTDALTDLQEAQASAIEAQEKLNEVMANASSTDQEKNAAKEQNAAAQKTLAAAEAVVSTLDEPQKLTLMDQLRQQLEEAKSVLAEFTELGIPVNVVAPDLVKNIAAIQSQINLLTASGALITQSVIEGDPTPLLQQLAALQKPDESDPDYGIKYPVYLNLAGSYAEGLARIDLDKATISSPVAFEVTGDGLTDTITELNGFKSAFTWLESLKESGQISEDLYLNVKGDWEGKVQLLEEKLLFFSVNPPIEFSVTGDGITDTKSEIDALKNALDGLESLKENGSISEEIYAFILGDWSGQLSDLESRLDELEGKGPVEVKVNVSGGDELFKGTSAFDSDEWNNYRVAINADDAETALENITSLVENLYGMSVGDLGITSDTITDFEQIQSIIKDLEENKTASLGDAIDTLSAKDIGDLGVGETRTVVQKLIDDLDDLDAKVIKDKTFTVTQNNTTTNTHSGDGGGFASGTNNAKPGVAILGEKKREILVSGNRFEIVGQNGPELRNLKSGDIVYNNKDTERILSGKNGKSNSGQAFSSGTGLLSAAWNWLVGGTSKSAGTVSFGTGTTNTTKKKSSSKKSSSSSKAGTFDQLWDWIEVKLTELQEITESFITSAGKAIGYLAQNLNLNSAIASVKTQLDSSKTAYDQYMAQAAKVATKYKLSTAIIDKIQNGSLEISSYDDATKQKIQDYQEWYDKAQDVKKAIEELREQESELAQEKLSNIVNDYENRLDRIDAKVSKAQAQIDKKTAQGKEVTASDYTAILNQTTSRLNTLTQERAALVAEFEAMVTAGYIQTDSDAWHEYTGQIEELDEALIEAEIDLADFKDSVSAINVTNLQYAMASLENSLQSIQDMQSLHDAQGTANSESSFTSLIQISQQMIQNLQEQNAELISQQSGLDVVSEKYQEIQSQINENNSSILQAKTSQEEWNDSIVDLQITALQNQRDEIEKTNDAYQRQLDIQQAQEDLDKAKQRRIRILKDGKFVYESDQNAIKEAQNKYDEVMHQETLNKIDEAIDALEALKSTSNIYDSNGNLIQGFSSGGINTRPGLAMLHGTPLEPEYIFNSDQISALQSLFAANVSSNQLNKISPMPLLPNNSSEGMRPIIHFDKIEMHEVNSVGDFFAELTNALPNAALQIQYKK